MALDTKEAMILAGERRFALDGIEGVSLRQIALDAKLRNESAALYHFGSREGLIRAILNYRVPRINARRETWLTDEDAFSTLSRERLIASAVIYPMAEEIFSNWRNCYWVRFASQLFSIEKYRHVVEEAQSQRLALSRVYDMLETIPSIDPMILDVRRETLRRDVVWGLKRIEAMSFEASRELCELHVANLVDMIAAGIGVAPSAVTLRRAEIVKRSRKRASSSD